MGPTKLFFNTMMIEKGPSLKITHRMIMVYLVGFVLFAGFAVLTVLNGQRIQSTTSQLAQQEIPGLIAVSAYKTYLQRQTVQLYELYATVNHDAFEKAQQDSKAALAPYVSQIEALPQYERVQFKLDKLNKQQSIIAERIVNIMRQPSVNWDGARTALAEFSRVADDMNLELDTLAMEVSHNVQDGAVQSGQQTSTLINTALVLMAISLIVGVFAAYNSHKHISTPLREVSNVLTGIADRKDLTYRVKQYSKDEVGDIASAANKLLDEFQRLARALDSSTQELNRTAKDLIVASDEVPKDPESIFRQIGSVKVISGKLQGLAENLQGQIKLLNF